MAHDINLTPEERHKAKMRTILIVTIILSVVTIVEFIFAFTMERGAVLTILFFVLTIAKAYYIVKEFMHLGHEVPSLKSAIIFPFIFILWLIGALLWEGSEVFHMRDTFDLF
ncbi:MAG: cytochrome C oxidase subunit IV family protein [Flammeovirgaceae bacterium]